MKLSTRARSRACSAAVALVAVFAVACGDDGAGDAGPTAPASPTTTTAPGDGHTHGPAGAVEVTWSPVPTVSVEVLEDPMAGWNLHATVTGHRLAPENVSTAPVDGEGHLHLYVDGVKVTRLYGEWFALGELDPGEHEIRVELSANDHSPLAVDGEVIDATATVTVAQPDGAAPHRHAEALEVTWSPVPTVSVEVLEDPMAGWNLHATVTGHRLAPENVSTAPVDGEGHLHLYVDGVKVTRLYGEWFALGELDPGEHEIRVELSANDHSPLAVDGEVIDATATVTVAGEPTGAAPSDGAGHEITIEVVDGSIVGGAQDHEVETGEMVTLTVTSDTTDEVHVHGYDLFADVEPGRVAQLTFEARFEGGYEIELEGAGVLLGQLVVG